MSEQDAIRRAAMTDRPTTAADTRDALRQVAAYFGDGPLMVENGIITRPAEARQPDSEALRVLLNEPYATPPPWEYRAVADAFLYDTGDFPPSPANLALAVKAVNTLAALPPSAPPKPQP